ncbi:tape measure protein [Roseospirillum parvum]|uniref:Phage tail tape measure protein, lambda family n=1 Tax=Roseospirillum parvum TaxID=83401 RepID=A0A1G8EWN5_9PROT|nr:tape measure protein [Roseospirillum parvum]SDH74255.1 phage tail tape measure protein, lambda family [Roseospirillum parvum]
MSQGLTLAIRLTGDGSDLRGELQVSRAELDKLGRGARSTGGALGDLSERAGRTGRAVEDMGGRARGTVGALSALYHAAAAYGGLRLAESAFRTADAYHALQARLRVATDGFGNAATVQARLLEISNDTGGSFESMVEMFQRGALGAREMGRSAEDVVRLTEIVQKLGVISGASGEALKAGGMQFSQALTSGVMRAEEFNSVMENIPAVGVAIAEGLGVSTGRLRQMVLDGQVLSEDVFEALLSQSEKVNAQFEQIPLLLLRARQAAGKTLSQQIGEMDTDLGLTAGAAEALQAVADNGEAVRAVLEAVAVTAGVAGAALGGRLTAALAGSAGGWLRNARAIKQEHEALLAEQAALRGAFLPDRQRLVAVNAQVAASERRLAAVLLSGATATGRLSVATRALTGARAALGGVVGLLGGPLGVAVTGATVAIGWLATQQTAAEQATRAHTAAVEAFEDAQRQARGAVSETTEAIQAQTGAAWQNARRLAEESLAQAEDALAFQRQLLRHADDGVFALPWKDATHTFRDLMAEWEAGRIEVDALADGLRALGDAAPEWKDTTDQVIEAAAAYGAAETAVARAAAQLKRANGEALTPAEEALLGIAEAGQEASREVDRVGTVSDRARERLQGLNVEVSRMRAALDLYSAGGDLGGVEQFLDTSVRRQEAAELARDSGIPAGDVEARLARVETTGQLLDLARRVATTEERAATVRRQSLALVERAVALGLSEARAADLRAGVEREYAAAVAKTAREVDTAARQAREARADLRAGLAAEAEELALRVRHAGDESGELEVQLRLLRMRRELEAAGVTDAAALVAALEEQVRAIEAGTQALEARRVVDRQAARLAAETEELALRARYAGDETGELQIQLRLLELRRELEAAGLKDVDAILARREAELRANAAVAGELERQAEALQRQAALLDGITGPADSYRQSMADLAALLDAGAISAEQYAAKARDLRLEMLAYATDAASGFERGWLRVQQTIEDTASVAEDAVVNAYNNMEDALVDFITTGEADFSDLIDSMLADITRLAIRTMAMQGLEALGATGADGGLDLSGLFSGVGDLFSGLFGAATGADMVVGGRGGTDSKVVAIRTTPGESIHVRTPAQRAATFGHEVGHVTAPIRPTVNQYISTPDADSFRRSQRQVATSAGRSLNRQMRRNG